MRYSTLPVVAVLAYTSASNAWAFPQIGSAIDSITSEIGGGVSTVSLLSLSPSSEVPIQQGQESSSPALLVSESHDTKLF